MMMPTLVAGFAAAVGVIAIVLAAICRGPAAVRLLGATIATRHGAPISRTRAMRRSLAWSPALVAVAVIFISIWLGPSRAVRNGGVGLVAIATLAVGAACSILEPRSSLPDRIARTVVIPL